MYPYCNVTERSRTTGFWEEAECGSWSYGWWKKRGEESALNSAVKWRRRGKCSLQYLVKHPHSRSREVHRSFMYCCVVRCCITITLTAKIIRPASVFPIQYFIWSVIIRCRVASCYPDSLCLTLLSQRARDYDDSWCKHADNCQDFNTSTLLLQDQLPTEIRIPRVSLVSSRLYHHYLRIRILIQKSSLSISNFYHSQCFKPQPVNTRAFLKKWTRYLPRRPIKSRYKITEPHHGTKRFLANWKI